ncbi:hypothetical protein [Burkholderia savannae]|uniref:hypothetical protein n=1 Tax=Burkholderia savannae TaxID=1637837 RepID=UPI000AFC9493|nr:hypothetical protein [Burkholderia savannae]
MCRASVMRDAVGIGIGIGVGIGIEPSMVTPRVARSPTNASQSETPTSSWAGPHRIASTRCTPRGYVAHASVEGPRPRHRTAHAPPNQRDEERSAERSGNVCQRRRGRPAAMREEEPHRERRSAHGHAEPIPARTNRSAHSTPPSKQ